MYTTETTRTPDTRSAQSGSILVVALVILVIAGSVSAGVAHLVGSGSTISANALQSEQAFYIAESVARSGPCEEGSYGKDNHVGHYNCVPGGAPCDSDQWHITAWIGNENQDNAQATHQICAPDPTIFSELDESECQDPDSVDWDDPPRCICSKSDPEQDECDGETGFNPSDIKDTSISIVVGGDMHFPGGASAHDFDYPVCVRGNISYTGNEPPTFNEGGCLTGEFDHHQNYSGAPNAGLDECTVEDFTSGNIPCQMQDATSGAGSTWSYSAN